MWTQIVVWNMARQYEQNKVKKEVHEVSEVSKVPEFIH